MNKSRQVPAIGNIVRALAMAIALLAAARISRAAEDTSELVSRGKKATALVDVESGRSFATAFCIDRAGYFVTNAHVVDPHNPDRLEVIITPGEAGEKKLHARVVRSDPRLDLALLKVEGAADLVALELGATEKLIETDSLTAFGYPFGKILAPDRQDYPSITVSTGKITSLRKVKGDLERIQLDASLNPGNSGGPVLGASGKVVGVVVSGIVGSGVNFAIPVEKLRQLLATPEITFHPPQILAGKAQDEHEFVVDVESLLGQATPFDVELVLDDGNVGPRKAPAQRKDGKYVAKIVPLPKPPNGPKLRITAKFSSGEVTGDADDRDVRIGDQTFRLSAIRGIEHADAWTVGLGDGRSISGRLSGLEDISLDLGNGVVLRGDLGKSSSVSVQLRNAMPSSIRYALTVRSDGKVVGKVDGVLSVVTPGQAATAPDQAVPVPATGNSDANPKRQGETTISSLLPAAADDVVTGASGRILAFKIQKLSKVAVFDVIQGKVVLYIPMPDPDSIVAASADKLILIDNTKRVMQRWNLTSHERELNVALPIAGSVQLAVMGASSSGPLLLLSANKGEIGGRTRLDFIDLETLKRMDVKQAGNGMELPIAQDKVQIRASASSDVFGSWNPGSSPSGIRTIVLANNVVQHYSLNNDALGAVIPSTDGAMVFTGAGTFTSDLKRIPPEIPQQLLLPAAQPPYFFSIGFFQNAYTVNSSPRPGSVYLPGADRPLVRLPETPEMTGFGNGSRFSIFSPDKHYYLLPSAKMFITIPPTHDRVFMRRFDILKAVEESGVDYLFVASNPPNLALKKKKFIYALEVCSKRGGVTFKLDSAPAGMNISADGVVTWEVAPADASDSNVSVIVTIKDNSGQSILHTFSLQIR